MPTRRHPLDVISYNKKKLPPRDQLVVDLREAADYAIAVRWANFAEDHPRLARVLSRPVMIRAVEAELMDDASFHKAMHKARLASEATRVLERWVRWSVNRLMKL